MSASNPNFYIGISINPPRIISIGQTIDGMEEVEVMLDQPDENKLADFENKINSIAISSEPVTAQSSVETPDAAQSVVETPDAAQSVVETTPDAEQSVVEQSADTAQSVVETPDTAQSVVETTQDAAQSVVEPTPAPTNRLTNRSVTTGPGNTIGRLAGMQALGNVASSLFGRGGAGKNTKKHKITKRYKNNIMKRRKTKRSKSKK